MNPGQIVMCGRMPFSVDMYMANNDGSISMAEIDMQNVAKNIVDVACCQQKKLILASDQDASQIHIISYSGQVLNTIELDYTPSHIKCAGLMAWVTSKEKKLYKYKINSKKYRLLPMKVHDLNGISIKEISANKSRIAICTGQNKVHVYSAKHDDILSHKLYTYGGEEGGRGEDKLAMPHDVTLDEYKNIYIADTKNNQIVKVDDDGKLVGYINTRDVGRPYHLSVTGNVLWALCTYTQCGPANICKYDINMI